MILELRKECIEFAAHKIHEKTGLASEECWFLAEDKLSLFPKKTKSAGTNTYRTNHSSYGSFGLAYINNIDGDWYYHHCREVIESHFFSHNTIYSQNGIYFGWAEAIGNKSLNIASFIRSVENKLRLIDVTTFQKTSWSNMLWVRPSGFWPQQSMRFSLFTILLRCGIHYDGYLQKALKSIQYALDTSKAIERFLEGYINYTGEHDFTHRKGWVYYLNNNTSNIEKLLVK